MSSDARLRREVDQWVESSAPAAPWLEQGVMGAVRAQVETGTRLGRRQRRGRGALDGFGSGQRFAAGLAAVLLAICTVAALLLGTRALHNLTVPAGRSTPTPNSIVPFTPSPPVRASNWPPGSPVPAQLAGAWQPPQSAQICRVNAGDTCTSSSDFGFERYSYVLEGNTLVLTRVSGPSCSGVVLPGLWPTLAGIYVKTISQ
jgi:hypothetical protein